MFKKRLKILFLIIGLFAFFLVLDSSVLTSSHAETLTVHGLSDGYNFAIFYYKEHKKGPFTIEVYKTKDGNLEKVERLPLSAFPSPFDLETDDSISIKLEKGDPCIIHKGDLYCW